MIPPIRKLQPSELLLLEMDPGEPSAGLAQRIVVSACCLRHMPQKRAVDRFAGHFRHRPRDDKSRVPLELRLPECEVRGHAENPGHVRLDLRAISVDLLSR